MVKPYFVHFSSMHNSFLCYLCTWVGGIIHVCHCWVYFLITVCFGQYGTHAHTQCIIFMCNVFGIGTTNFLCVHL